MDNQQAELIHVPLDFYQEAIDYIDQNFESPRPLTTIGGSKGAELSLLLSAYYKEIDNVVLYSPAFYVL